MHEYGKVFLTLLVTLLLPSCGAHTKKNRKAASQRAAFLVSEIETQIDIHQNVVELEAKLTDIPTIIGSRTLNIVQINEQPQQLRLEIECSQSLAEVDSYYTQQMVCNGWQTVTRIADDEIMQIYKKPQKMCVIIIRSKTSAHTKIDLLIAEIQAEI